MANYLAIPVKPVNGQKSTTSRGERTYLKLRSQIDNALIDGKLRQREIALKTGAPYSEWEASIEGMYAVLDEVSAKFGGSDSLDALGRWERLERVMQEQLSLSVLQRQHFG